MSNFEVQVPVPVAPGLGAAVDVTSMGAEKTFVIEGTGDGQIVLDGSHDDTNFFPFAIYDILTDPSPKKITIVLARIRARRISGTGTVSLTASGEAGVVNTFVTLAVPMSNGAGAPSALGTSGMIRTAAVIGPYVGIIGIEASGNGGITFDPVVTFNTGQSDFKTFDGAYSSARVRRYNARETPIPIVTVGASAAGSAATCGCDCIENTYKTEDDFTSLPSNNPNWQTIGLVESIPAQGGAWRLSVTADPGGVAQSLMTGASRTIAFASNTGAIPNPPLSIRARLYVSDADPNGKVLFTAGLADLAHDVFLAIGAGGLFPGPPQWFALVNDGVNPLVAVPTGVPLHTTCETAQTFRIEQDTSGNVTFFIDDQNLGTFPVPAASRQHLYAPAANVERQIAAASGFMVVDFFCAAEGRVCLDDPGVFPFPGGGDWIQSESNRTSNDFSTVNVGGYDLIQNVSFVTGGNFIIGWAAISCENDTAGAEVLFRFTIDGAPVPGSEVAVTCPTADTPFAIPVILPKTMVAPGSHTIALEWGVSAGTGKILSGTKPTQEYAAMTIAEVAV